MLGRFWGDLDDVQRLEQVAEHLLELDDVLGDLADAVADAVEGLRGTTLSRNPLARDDACRLSCDHEDDVEAVRRRLDAIDASSS